MSKRNLLIFILLGLAGGLLCGIIVYDLNNDRLSGQVDSIIREFFLQISEGNLTKAEKCLRAADQGDLERPNTALGEAVYRELRLLSIENISRMENDQWSAEVIVQFPDTLIIMGKVMELLPESFLKADETEQNMMLESVYEALLAREDLPMVKQYIKVKLTQEEGSPRVVFDEQLRSAIEGNIRENWNTLQNLGGKKD